MLPTPDDKPDALRRGRGAGGWRAWAEEGRAAGAEALGTALLVALTCLPAAPPAAAGAVVAMLVQCFDHLSGAMFNPTVLLAAALWRRVTPRRVAALLPAQLAGAVAGAAALRLLFPAAAAAAVTRPAAGVAPWAAAALEAAGGACLALANCSTWDARTAHLRDSWPLRIGVTVAALTLVMSGLTGASFNPARSFGPALLDAVWDHHWVYWVGPLAGSAAATLLYAAVWRPPPA